MDRLKTTWKFFGVLAFVVASAGKEIARSKSLDLMWTGRVTLEQLVAESDASAIQLRFDTASSPVSYFLQRK